jgi:hypothetical protein
MSIWVQRGGDLHGINTPSIGPFGAYSPTSAPTAPSKGWLLSCIALPVGHHPTQRGGRDMAAAPMQSPNPIRLPCIPLHAACMLYKPLLP